MKTTIRLFYVTVIFLCVALSAELQAVSPPPDGAYPGGNTAEGQNALFGLTTGGFNTAVGFLSLKSDTIGQLNTAVGAGTLLANTADGNTATGAGALLSNTAGNANTASGAFALFSNTTGHQNTAVGEQALFNNIGGSNDDGSFNTATGFQALFSNTTGLGNTAMGDTALATNSVGIDNTAVGDGAMINTTSSLNTAVGAGALAGNSTGNSNIAIGFSAGQFNITGSDNIDIGSSGSGADSGTIRIGSGSQTKTFIAGIRGVTTGQANAIPVLIDSLGQLGTMSSARRFKDNVEPMDKTSEAILNLNPVTFHYKSDKTNTPQFGLIAEEVAAINPALVVRDQSGEIYTVRYDVVNAMLLNEFLKEHKKVAELSSRLARQEVVIAQQHQELRTTTTRQENEILALTASLKEQAAHLQSLSAQVEMNKSATKLADVGR
jgi:hypothetical protein